MSSANDLPVEIINKVLHHLYTEHEWRRDPGPNLTSYALVAKAWAQSAQVLVYRYIPESKCVRFHQAVHCFKLGDRSAISSLLQHVRVLEVSLIPSGTSSTGSSARGITQDELLFLIEACPQLYELKLIIRGVFDISRSFGDHLLAPGKLQTSILALQLSGCSVESPLLYSLLACLPQVQFVTLGSELSVSPPAHSPQHRLYELALQRNIGQEQLHWILASSIGSLEVLELRDLPGSETIMVLDPHLPYLRSLRLINYNAKCASLVEKCTQLKELTLWNLPSVFPIKELPHSLEHLAFVHYSFTLSVDLQPIINLVKVLPRLQVVTCGQQLRDDQNFSSLRDVCSAKGVDLRPDLNKYWPAEYPIKTRRFPRRRSASNFYLMHPGQEV